ncbi:metal-sulfur cluster assembly factor [soil metagenome]
MSEASTEASASEAPATGLPTTEAVLEALKVVKDPEIPLNVVDLGLIYDLNIDEDGSVTIEMTLTSMGCPVQDMIQADAELAAMKVEGVKQVSVDFVWSPPWSPAKMSDDGKKQMRMFGFNL